MMYPEPFDKEEFLRQSYDDLSPKDREFIKKLKKEFKDKLEWLKGN